MTKRKMVFAALVLQALQGIKHTAECDDSAPDESWNCICGRELRVAEAVAAAIEAGAHANYEGDDHEKPALKALRGVREAEPPPPGPTNWRAEYVRLLEVVDAHPDGAALRLMAGRSGKEAPK